MNAVYAWTNGDTITHLAETLEIEGYGIGIVEIYGRPKIDSKYKNKALFLCSDICQDTYVGSIKLPVLRMLMTNSNSAVTTHDIKKVIWLRVTRRSINHIRLYICDEKGELVSLGNKRLNCTLLFIPDRTIC